MEFTPLACVPRFLCLTLTTPGQTHELILLSHVLACWTIPAAYRKQKLPNSHKSEMGILSVSNTLLFTGRPYSGGWPNLFDFF